MPKLLKEFEICLVYVDKRHEGFAEVELCLGDDQARGEVRRCLHCDLERSLAMEIRAKEL